MGRVRFSGEHAAQDRFNLTFAPGLVEALAHHIRSQHGHEISQHNGGGIAQSGFGLAFAIWAWLPPGDMLQGY